MEEQKVSIVVPAYNEEENIGRLLSDLKRLNYGNLEIIVVDDGSTDGTVEIVRSHQGIRVLSRDHKGIAHTLNTGIEEASGDYILQMGADIRVHDSNLVKKMISHFGEEVAAVWGLIDVENSENFFPSMMQASKRLEPWLRYGGSFMMFGDFIKENRYDESYSNFSASDSEIREKIENSHLENKYISDVSVGANYPESFPQAVKQRYRYARSHVRWMKKQFDKSKCLQVLRDLSVFGGLTFLPLLGLMWMLAFMLIAVFGFFSYRAVRGYDRFLYGFMSIFAEFLFIFVRIAGYLREIP